MWDVAIIGAGLSGITCGQQLTAAGINVCLLDKSRGLGGRLATRRVSPPVGQPLRVDHGLPYWQPQSAGLQSLTAELLDVGLLRPWPVSVYEIQQRGWLTPMAHSAPVYVAAAGMSAIAKHLTRNFTPGENLLTDHRATTLRYQGEHWSIGCEGGERIVAKQCVIAIPAPQAAALLSTWNDHDPRNEAISDAISQINAVNYHPCLTVLAGYDRRYYADMGELDPKGWMVSDTAGSSTHWVGLDSSKRDDRNGLVIVIHSKPGFAQQYRETSDLQPAASVLLRACARKFKDWIAQPEWFQIHRWRYARVSIAYPEAVLSIGNSLICGGDWCRPPRSAQLAPDLPALQGIDYAYLSGLAMAEAMTKAMSSEEAN